MTEETEPVTREVVLDVRLPDGLPVERVDVRRIRMVAGHYEPAQPRDRLP